MPRRLTWFDDRPGLGVDLSPSVAYTCGALRLACACSLGVIFTRGPPLLTPSELRASPDQKTISRR